MVLRTWDTVGSEVIDQRALTTPTMFLSHEDELETSPRPTIF